MTAPTVVFDLDGTLIDSEPDLRAALNRLMTQHAAPPFERPEVVAMIGDGVDALVRRALAARKLDGDPAGAEAAIAAFRQDYARHSAVKTEPYPGAIAVLHMLKGEGWRVAVCTNKPDAAARSIVRALRLPVHAVTGGDGPRKPDPAHLLAAVRLAGGDPSRAVMVGDHANDVNAARAASMPAIFAAWGYGTPAMGLGASAVAADISEVPGMVDALRG